MTQAVDASFPAIRPLRGALMVVLAVFTFAVGDVLNKHLVMLYPPTVVSAARYLINLLLMLVIFGPKMGAELWHAERRWLVVARALCLALATLTLGYSLQVMPVGETIAIVYLAPFAVMLLAAPVLGERVSAAGWIGAFTGFAGVLLILRPGAGLDPVGVAFAILNAALGTFYHLLSRMLAHKESTESMLFHVALVGTVVSGAAAIPHLHMAIPTTLDLALMLLLGICATAGHFLITASYREAPASLLAPINYVHLVWVGLLGWLVFGHLPDAISLIGMGMVCAAGAGMALYAHYSRKEVSP